MARHKNGPRNIWNKIKSHFPQELTFQFFRSLFAGEVIPFGWNFFRALLPIVIDLDLNDFPLKRLDQEITRIIRQHYEDDPCAQKLQKICLRRQPDTKIKDFKKYKTRFMLVLKREKYRALFLNNFKQENCKKEEDQQEVNEVQELKRQIQCLQKQYEQVKLFLCPLGFKSVESSLTNNISSYQKF